MQHSKVWEYSEIAVGVITVTVALAVLLLLIALVHLAVGERYIESVGTLATVATTALTIIIAAANAGLAYFAYTAAKSFKDHNTFEEAKTLVMSLSDFEKHTSQFYDLARFLILRAMTMRSSGEEEDKERVSSLLRDALVEFEKAVSAHEEIFRQNGILLLVRDNIDIQKNEEFRIHINEIMNTLRADKSGLEHLTRKLRNKRNLYFSVQDFNENSRQYKADDFMLEKEKGLQTLIRDKDIYFLDPNSNKQECDLLKRLTAAVKQSHKMPGPFSKYIAFESNSLDKQIAECRDYMRNQIL